MTSVLGEKLREAIEKKSLATTIKQWDDEDNNMKQNVKDIPVINLNNTIHPPVKPKEKKLFSVTTNSSRVTFDYVYNNMGKYNVQEVAANLAKQGHKESTVASLCYQMLKRDMFTKNEQGKLFTTIKEFVPIKSANTLKKKAVVIIKRRNANVEAGIAALQEKADAHVKKQQWNADEVVAGLSVLQARELYLKLKEIFGG